MKEIGENIRKLRESKKISQYAVAYTIGISQAAYSKIERGETEIKATHLYMIAGVFKISVYDLLPPSLSSGLFDRKDYLLKPVFDKVRQIWFTFLAQKRLKRSIQDSQE
jgi:transcriptional regulator with XRE-family HTH domain